MSDAEALDWLDRLLAADEQNRAASLHILATRNPQLHARLQRLLASALAPEQSRVIGAPSDPIRSSSSARAGPAISKVEPSGQTAWTFPSSPKIKTTSSMSMA